MKPYTITIPAGGVEKAHTPGKFFLVTSLGGAFRVVTNLQNEFSFDKTGSGFGDEQAPRFAGLTFYNDGGADIDITFYVSDTPIKVPDVNVSSAITVNTSLQNTLANCAVEAEGQFQAASGVGGLGARFAPAGTYFRRAIIIAQKSLDRVANAGNVYIGNAQAHQPIKLAPGDVWTIEADTGGKRDFGSWWVSADNAGDGVSVIYV